MIANTLSDTSSPRISRKKQAYNQRILLPTKKYDLKFLRLLAHETVIVYKDIMFGRKVYWDNHQGDLKFYIRFAAVKMKRFTFSANKNLSFQQITQFLTTRW